MTPIIKTLVSRLLVCGLFVLSQVVAAAGPYSFDGVDRVVAIGDLHGDYDNYMLALREAGLVKKSGHWTGGTTHLVQLGDIPSRGPDAVKIMRHIRVLAAEAEEAGGRVHVLIGNHEAMNMLGDLRYVHPNTYSQLKSRDSRALRKRYFKRTLAARRETDPDYRMTNQERDQWHDEHPLGWIEHRRAWQPEGEFGEWLLERPLAIRINDTLFVHGGISPTLAPMSLESLNTAAHEELRQGPVSESLPLTEGELGPLWYRGYAYPTGGREGVSESTLDATLAQYDVRRVVVGHTPGFGTVLPRFDGRIILADTGISEAYGGHVGAVEITEKGVTLLQAGKAIPVPQSDEALLGYLESVAAAVKKPAKNLGLLIDILREQAAATQDG